MKKISIIVPFYYNQENVPITLKRLYQVFNSIKKEYLIEFIFVDDGSKDKTWENLNKFYSHSYDHKLLKLSKNFGSHYAILAGLQYSDGDGIGLITSDLQDPPEIFLDMISNWEKETDIVIAVRNAREDKFLQRFAGNIYYKLIEKFSNTNMPIGGFDFFFIDKKVSRVLANMMEKNSSITCQIAWAGFNRKIIYYKRQKRMIGKSKWNLNKKIKLFVDSFASFSIFPIRLIQIFAFFFSVVGFIYLIVIVILKINGKILIHGIATVIGILCIASGLILFSLSIIGEYVWRVLDESRKRPPFIVEKYLNVKKSL
jgi:polyisoprenyl-phosphate glycosyltransferase